MSFGPPPPARPKNPPAPISSQLGLGVGLSLNGATFGAKKEQEGSSATNQSGPSVSPTPPAQQPHHTNTNYSAKGSPQGKLRYGATGPPPNRQGRLQGSTTQEDDLSSDDGNEDEGSVSERANTTLTAPSTAPSASRFRESLQDVVSTNRRITTPPPFVTSNTTAQTLHRNTTSAPSSSAAQGNRDASVSASSSSLAARYRSKTGRPEPTPDGANHPPSPTNAYDDGLEQLLSAVSATNDELLNVLDTDTGRVQSTASRYASEEGAAEGNDEELPDASEHELFDAADFYEDGDDYVRTTTASSMWSVATSSASAFSRRSSAAMWWRSRGAKRGAPQAQGTSAVNNEGPSSSFSVAVTDSTASSFLSRSLSMAAVSRIQGTLAAPMKRETQGVALNSGAASPAPPIANPFQLNAPLSSDIPLTADGTAIALTKADIANIKDEETLKFLADNSRWLAKYIVERERQQSESSPQPGGESLTSPPTLNSTFITAVDTTGKEYSIAVVEPHESQTLAKGGAAGQHPPVLEIPLELIDFDVAEDYYAEREEPEESTVQVGDTPRSSAPDRTTLFSHERDADLVLSELLLEEGGDGDLLLSAADAVNNDVSDEDQMVKLLLAAIIADEPAHATDQTVGGLGRVGGGTPTLVGAAPTPSPSEPAISDDIDEKAIAARVDADKIRARMRSQQTFLTSTHQQVGASINGPVGGIGVASSVGSSVASSLLKSHMGVTKEKIDELRAMREFALAKRLEMLEVKMAEGQRKRQAELDELQQGLETALNGEPSKEAKPATINTTTSKFGVKYAGKKGGPPRRPPAQQVSSSVEQAPTANPYILMAQRLQRQLDDHRRAKLEQAQHQQKGSELTSPSTTALLRGDGFDESLLNQSSASASSTSFANAAAQLGLARAAAKAKGHLLTDDESARVDALLSFDGLWGAVGGPSTPKVDPSGLVNEPSLNANSAQSLEDHLASILGDGYAQTVKDRQRSAAIDERLQKLQMVREQLAFNHFGVGGDDGSTSGASAASATNHALSNDVSLVGLAKVDTALLSANVSALLQRLQQQHDRKWQQQQADLLQQSLAGGGASSATTTAQSPVAPPSVADDPRSLEQIADAKLDSQRRRLGNLYLKEAAEAKLQRAYLKQLNAELDRIYAQNESLESDPTFAVARKYDLHQDPNALAFPTGVQPVSEDQLQRLLGAARAEEELMRPLSEEDERSKVPEGYVLTAGGEDNMDAKSAALGVVNLAQPSVTTPFQDALRDRLAKAQQMVEEEAVLDAQRHKEDQEAANRANDDDAQEDGAEAAAALKAVVA